MTKNLKTADLVVKLALATLVVIFYFTGVISGPFAKMLMILSLIVIGIFVAKFVLTKFLID